MYKIILLIASSFTYGCTETGISSLNGGSDGVSDVPVDTGISWDREDETEESEEDPEDEEPNTEETPEDEDAIEEDEPVDVEEPPEDDCDYTSDLVYVIDRADEAIYLFDPTDYSFDLVGELDCGIFAGSPGSMSVSRDGYAYVRYSDNTVYQVDLESMECVETSYDVDFGGFGMGYATNSGSTWRDQLYVANANEIAVVNTDTWNLSVIGSLPSQSELTGNADGELWAILPLETPAKLVEVNKTNGSIVDTINLSSMPNPTDIDTFAFATWGGEFWVFIRTYGMGSSTDVYRVTSGGVMTKVSEDTGMDVVGAGVSTCAPTD